ncbi:MAG: ABC transporter substrate-binding protein [Hyphomicrobiaceae bacterium]|nr:ABC transporter substrate-binding protein [Hyphomicrobiaceae bacterium]
MFRIGTFDAGALPAARSLRFVAFLAAAIFAAGATWVRPAQAADPAVVYMAQVGRELMAAARSRSPSMMAQVIQKHGDIAYIGLYALGAYKSKLSTTDKPEFYAGTTRFMARYAANEAPKYPIEKVEWVNESVRGGSGIMVDSTVTLKDGSTYDVRWLLSKAGSSYKVRDAMVYGFWMTPFLKKLFEEYVAENGGNVRALTAALNR